METTFKNIIKASLELGGKVPTIVMKDTDINSAIEYIKNSRIINFVIALRGFMCKKIFIKNL